MLHIMLSVCMGSIPEVKDLQNIEHINLLDTG